MTEDDGFITIHPQLPHRRLDMTKGEYRVGIDFFAPTMKNEAVQKIERAAADLIDLIQDIREDHDGHAINPEIGRLESLAQTSVEEAAMWAVKAATKPKP